MSDLRLPYKSINSLVSFGQQVSRFECTQVNHEFRHLFDTTSMSYTDVIFTGNLICAIQQSLLLHLHASMPSQSPHISMIIDDVLVRYA